MLLRICDHFRDNPKRIDKLIAIKGLPEEWFYREGTEGKELKRPWEADIDKNIPQEVRHLCDPIYITFRYPPIERGAKEVIEKKKILGVRIDYNSEPGRQMWDDIERFVEESMPRNERIPVPVICAKDEHAAFETYMPRRTARGSLELVPAPVPFVDLTKYIPEKVQPVIPSVAEVEKTGAISQPVVPQPVEARDPSKFKCENCSFTHYSPNGLRMHRMKKHDVRHKVVA